jgi:phage baseplate assembly protein W
MAANQTVTVHGVQPFTPIIKDATQHKKVVYGLNYPLGYNKGTGGFFAKEGNVALIRDAVKQLLQTERGERVMLPNFGCNLRKYLFQPLDEQTFLAIREEILYSFKKYIVGATVKKLSIIPFGEVGPAGGNSLKVTLIIQLKEEDLTVFDVEVLIK